MLPEDLERFRIGSLRSIYYVPDFVSEQAEASLLASVNTSTARWTQLSGRRLQMYGASNSNLRCPSIIQRPRFLPFFFAPCRS